MDIQHLTPAHPDFPKLLLDIPQPPQELFVLGEGLSKLMDRLRIAVVGTRLATPYGRQVTLDLTRELAAQGAVIVSGLAVGIDALAHQAALDAEGKTIAVLACGLDTVYPFKNIDLARQILKHGGVLISEYPPGVPVLKHQFIERNRLISGLSEAVLIPEAGHKSGSLHTADFALEQGKTVMAVPGNITSAQSVGTNTLIRTGSAAPITELKDIYYALNLKPDGTSQTQLFAASPEEAILLRLLNRGVNDGVELLEQSQLATEVFHQTLTMLEISGRIQALGANQWTIY